jgi:gliding motility-associated-like protein
MERNSQGSFLKKLIKNNLANCLLLVCFFLMKNTVQGQTYTSAQTINITADGRYQFLVKGGAGTGKLNGDVRDPNAVSANGNWGGTGATITANFYLLTGDIVYVIPGAAAQYDHAPVGGGGGGSAVIVNRGGNFHLLVVAGGGGGGGFTEIGLGGSITNYNGTQAAAGGSGDVNGGGGGGGVGAGLGGGAGNSANGGSQGIITNHVAASAGSAVNGSNGASGFGAGGGGGVANRIPSTPGGGGGGGGYIGGNGAAPGVSATGGTSYVNNIEAGFSALYMSAVAGIAGGNSAYSGNAGFVTVTLLPPPPTVTSFSPLQAKPGDAVTISGTNFNTTLANNIVFFGATKAIVTAANATSLTVTVPAGATNSVISVLNTGTNLSAFSQKAFLPIFTPVKSSIELADFAPRVNFTAGTNPGYVTMGDLDGDGKPDMAASNQADNTVSVFLNNGSLGNPSFAAGITLTTGQAPQGVAIGDIDGDGKPDMAVTSYNGNLVSVFRNTSTTGNISFAAKVDIALGSCPFFVVIRDMDGDGRADMVTANKDANTVSIVLNTGEVGSISFAERVDLATGLKPYSVTVGDLDDDGKPDVAASAFEANNIVVFRNKSTVGLVSFEARQDFAVTTPYSISIGDLDGDGKSDLVTGNLTSNNISVFRNTSVVGTISFAAKSDIAIGQRIYNVAIGDLDGDGKNDLATSNYTGNTVSVLRNIGTSGTIGFAAQVALPTGAGPNYVSIADMEGDGKPDLLVTNYDANSISILRNDPVGLNVSGALSSVNTTYGAASASPASFTVSGTNMQAGVTITPPVGYEVSQTAGGASGYAGSGTAIVVGATGMIASTTVYVRLAANLIIGAYSGNIVCSSTHATTVNLATVSSTVSPAPLTITASNTSKTYGTSLAGGAGSTAFTAVGLQNSETIASVSIAYTAGTGNGNTATDAVGTYTAKVIPSAATGGTFTASNYAITYSAGNVAVTPAALSITAANASKTYGTTLTGGAGSTAFAATGLVNAETIGSVSIAYTAGAGNGNTATDAVGTYTAKVIPSAATGGTFTASNYAITYSAGNVAVTPAALSITATNASKTYGTTLTGGAGSTAFAATGLVNAETIGSVSIAYTAGAGNGNTATDAVGTYTAKVIPSAATGGTFTASNYAITYSAGNVAVTPAALSITAANASKTYGTTLTGGAGSTAFAATGLVNAETIGSVSIAYTAGAGNGNTATDAVGTYTAKVIPSAATGGTFTASNYAITYSAGNVAVTPAALSITAANASKTYGTTLTGGAGSAAFAATGLVNAETIGSVSIAYTAGAGNGNMATDAAGIYTGKVIPGAATGGTFVAANYAITYAPGNILINKAPLTITALNKTRNMGTSDPVFTGIYTGFVNGETEANLSLPPVFSTTATLLSSAGTYPISPSGAVSNNYNITYVNGVLTVVSVINSAPTLAVIANQAICFTTQTQNLSLSGITPGTEAAQLLTLSVSSSNSSLFRTMTVSSGSNGTGILSYSVNPGASGTATVTLTVKDDGGTDFGGTDTFSRTFTITVNPIPMISISSSSGTEISKGLTTVLTATGGTNYTWATASGIIGGQNTATLTVRPSLTTTYNVMATNASGCTSSQNFTVNVLDDFQAVEGINIMTPNGDGKNDALVIKNLDMYPDNTLRIFDRGGRQIYVKKNYTNDWVGTLNGSNLKEDTYYYILEFGKGGRIKGFVSIVGNR